MRPNVTLSVALLLVVAAVAAPMVAGRGSPTLDRTACTTTETETRTVTILANGTRLREVHEEKRVDCPGTAKDVHEEESERDYDEEHDEKCDSTRTTVEKEYTLTNGTEVAERRVSVTRDCPGTANDIAETTTTVRYRPLERDDEEDDDRGSPSNRSAGKGRHLGWFDNATKAELKAEWKEGAKGNASRGHAHAFGTLCDAADEEARACEEKVALKAEWKAAEKGNLSWFRGVLTKIRGDAPAAEAEDERPAKAEKAKEAKAPKEERKGLREALKHVPSDVVSKLRAFLDGLRGRGR